MSGTRKPSIPKFIQETSVITKADRRKYHPHMTNWHKCRKYLSSRKMTADLIAIFIHIEMTNENPREGMLRNLLQKYNSARRIETEVQLEKFISSPFVEHIEKHSTKRKRQEKEDQENFDPGLQI